MVEWWWWWSGGDGDGVGVDVDVDVGDEEGGTEGGREGGREGERERESVCNSMQQHATACNRVGRHPGMKQRWQARGRDVPEKS